MQSQPDPALTLTLTLTPTALTVRVYGAIGVAKVRAFNDEMVVAGEKLPTRGGYMSRGQ